MSLGKSAKKSEEQKITVRKAAEYPRPIAGDDLFDRWDWPAWPSRLGFARRLFPYASPIDLEVDRIFDWPNLIHSFRWPSMPVDKAWVPAVDIERKGDKLTITADLPGVKKGDVTVELDGRTLIVKGSRKEESESKEKDYYRSERFEGEFMRRLILPEGAKTEDIDASYEDGVLKISVPVPHVAKAKQIEIKTK